ncbi:MAG: hypothetical protein R3F62_01960 [Planctomycetota bacterium]
MIVLFALKCLGKGAEPVDLRGLAAEASSVDRAALHVEHHLPQIRAVM